MVAIGLVTYIIVFNLNQMVKFGKTNYQHLKTGMFDTMQKDKREPWSKKGELFHRHRPRANAEQAKPSEWWILVYILQKNWDIVLFRKTKGSTEKENGDSEEVVCEAPAEG
jgi:hypothetical protein